MQKTYLLVIGMTVCLLFLIPACTVEQGPYSAELKAPEDIQMLSLGDTTYYIDSETGDDARPGTSLEMPWKSLRKVNSVTFAAGDKILFKAGSRYTGLRSAVRGNGPSSSPRSHAPRSRWGH